MNICGTTLIYPYAEEDPQNSEMEARTLTGYKILFIILRIL